MLHLVSEHTLSCARYYLHANLAASLTVYLGRAAPILSNIQLYTLIARKLICKIPDCCLISPAKMLHARFRPLPCTGRANRPELVSQMRSQPAVSRQQLAACHAARCRQCRMQHAATAVSRQPCSAASAGSPLEHQQPQARRRVAVAAAAADSNAGGGDADMEAAARGEISEESEPHASIPSATMLQAVHLCHKRSASVLWRPLSC